MIAGFDTLNAFRQVAGSDTAWSRNVAFTEAQFTAYHDAGLVLYDEDNIPNYHYDAQNGFLACGDGFLRETTGEERSAWAQEFGAPTPNILYVDIALTPTDGSSSFTGLSGLLAVPNDATGSFDVAASVWADDALTVPVSALGGLGWVFILRKINKQDGAVLDTLRLLKTFVGNACAFTLACDGVSSGRYSLDARDFDTLTMGTVSYRFVLASPNSPEGRDAIEFDIYDAFL